LELKYFQFPLRKYIVDLVRNFFEAQFLKMHFITATNRLHNDRKPSPDCLSLLIRGRVAKIALQYNFAHLNFRLKQNYITFKIMEKFFLLFKKKKKFYWQE